MLQTKELTFYESIKKSRELGDLVKQSYNPDLVVGITSGGILPTNEISKKTNISYSWLTARRDINLKKTYEAVPDTLKPFIRLYQGFLFITKKPSLIEEGNFDCKGKKILIVDDTIHTGKTLEIVTKNLEKRGAKQIKSAAINCINNNLADYFLTKGKIKFPWSKNSPYYNKFEAYIKKIENKKPKEVY